MLLNYKILNSVFGYYAYSQLGVERLYFRLCLVGREGKNIYNWWKKIKKILQINVFHYKCLIWKIEKWRKNKARCINLYKILNFFPIFLQFRKIKNGGLSPCIKNNLFLFLFPLDPFNFIPFWVFFFCLVMSHTLISLAFGLGFKLQKSNRLLASTWRVKSEN